MARQPKPWWESKIILANLLTVAAAMLAAPELLDLMGPGALRYVAAVQALITIALRFVSAGPVTLRKERR